jgi:type IX secretion system substrate protein/Kelch motif protein
LCTFTQVYQATQWCGNFPALPGNGPIYGHASVVFGDTIYVAGGSMNSTPSVNFYKYSISGNLWTTGNTLPGPKSGGDLVAARGKIYYIGGGNLSIAVASPEQYVYNPANGTWSSIADIPTPVSGNDAEVYNDSLIYSIMGGWSSFETIVQVYNISSNSWSQATPVSNGNGRRTFAGAIMGNKIFVCAGYDGSFRNDFWTGTINPANPMQITWQQRTNLAIATSRPGGTAINGRFYVIIGEMNNGYGSDSIAIWDDASSLWSYVDGKPTRTNNLNASTSSSIVICNGRPGVKVWAVGGSIQNQTTRPLDVFADTCLTGCTPQLVGIENNYIPVRYELLQNYPNPFNPVTKIEFNIPENTRVSLSISDITGREISLVLNEYMQWGHHSLTFDGTGYSSGVYFYRIVTDKFNDCKKMVLIK